MTQGKTYPIFGRCECCGAEIYSRMDFWSHDHLCEDCWEATRNSEYVICKDHRTAYQEAYYIKNKQRILLRMKQQYEKRKKEFSVDKTE